MKRLLFRTAVWGAIAAVLVLIIAALGLMPFGAASGRTNPVDWLGRFAMRRSIAVRAWMITPPPLDDPSLVMRGAGHFETVCRGCHGAPGGEQPVPMRRMLPRPPDLLHVTHRYSPGELYQIVKHGIRMSGMPGWPTQERDDEVWAMVAFLRELPSLGRDGYVALVTGNAAGLPQSVPRLVQTACARCHGADGLGRGLGAFPRLAGQHTRYLHLSLRAFAYGTRHSGIMSAVADTLSDEQMLELAAYYSAQPGLSASRAEHVVPPVASGTSPTAREVPVCESCHVHEGVGNAAYPILGGQYPDYLALQLRLFAERRRGGTPFANLMHPVADALGDEFAATARTVAGTQ